MAEESDPRETYGGPSKRRCEVRLTPFSFGRSVTSRNYRVAVVPMGTPEEATLSVLRALSRSGDIVAVPLKGVSQMPFDCVGVVVVTRTEGLAATASAISQWHSGPQAMAILVAGIDLDASQLDTLLNYGIHDFVSMPFMPQELLTRLRRALSLLPALPSSKQSAVLDLRLRHFIGANREFANQVAKLPKFAGCNASVLIVGETGTGKEVCAQAIHYLSARASKPWVAVNCGAIPIELVENELFGHAKGAYTAAHSSREGLVREAEGGTLFLDDIDCLPLPAQVKLLRFLQEREYRPVGSNRVQRADVRVIAASSHRLPQMLARGEFRQDLYFRLNVLALELPPLRDRRDDIAALVLHFIQLFRVQYNHNVTGVSPRALERLLVHDWPGNVRELQHAIERAVLMASGPTLAECDIDIADPDPKQRSDESFRAAKDRVVRQFERSYIEHLLACCEGNVTRAAQHAHKNRRAFFELMRKYDIAPGRFRQEPGERRHAVPEGNR